MKPGELVLGSWPHRCVPPDTNGQWMRVQSGDVPPGSRWRCPDCGAKWEVQMPEKPHTGQRLNGPHWYRKSSGRWWRLLRRFGLASAHDGPTMPERIEVAGAEDLMPMDMLEEGRTIRSIRFGAGRSIETATVRRGHEHLDDGTFYWLPIWSDHRDEPYPDFPVTVLRGAPIPEAPCEICAAKTSSHDRGDGA